MMLLAMASPILAMAPPAATAARPFGIPTTKTAVNMDGVPDVLNLWRLAHTQSTIHSMLVDAGLLDMQSPGAHPTAVATPSEPKQQTTTTETVLEWCASRAHQQSARIMQNGLYSTPHMLRRSHVPMMSVMTATNDKARNIRKSIHDHRDARQDLRHELERVENERRVWASVCEGDECEIRDKELVDVAQGIGHMLDEHKTALETLDDEQRGLLQP